MTGHEQSREADPEASAQRAADKLALALEDVGYDVGQAFPLLHGSVDTTGVPVVELGRVSQEVASGLSAVLSEAAQRGIALPPRWVPCSLSNMRGKHASPAAQRQRQYAQVHRLRKDGTHR